MGSRHADTDNLLKNKTKLQEKHNKEVYYPIQGKETYMWQSRVEIEHYSIAYFDRIAAFEAL